MTVLDDRISMVQCLGEDVDVHYVAVSLREQDGKRREWSLLTAEGDRRQEVTLPSGVAVDLRTAFQGLPVLDENDIRVSSLSGDVTVYLVLAASDQRIEMAFRNIEASSLVEGAYIYYSGEVSTQACGMKRD